MSTIATDQTRARAAAHAEQYRALSRELASRGDARRAALALWASDVQVLVTLLWESGLAGAPDPAAQLRAVATAVGHAVDERLTAATGDGVASVTTRDLLEQAREALTGAFDASVHAMLTDRFAPSDHLDGVGSPEAGAAEQARQRRLGSRQPGDLVNALRVAAEDCAVVAAALAADGDEPGALRQRHMAELAAFEAVLVQAALAVGDHALGSVELRWDLAEHLLPPGVEPELEHLAVALHPAEEGALRAECEARDADALDRARQSGADGDVWDASALQQPAAV